ncbi:MAG: succinate dehydrogenase, cytochrome b556 subunit [Methylococcaceae bacterium]|nr:succinate dehydrogenase, cytochrome b556 subunit [Methylococcaceae bacterium]MCI0668517.1 succinate dehydrogenase, cytochrome b556 subunit [Methylococcaceae bacterium]MCI0733540.1 succinate dehydrogenase, cytochrome b556 subunit [Methylococcaceae bacterium]
MKEPMNRPLSPHLQIYRLPLTSILSITHRATGVAVTLGMIYLVVWLMGISEGAGAFENTRAFLDSGFGLLVLFLWTFALFFHFVHGIRHLIWDTGMTFERAAMDRLAAIEIGTAVGITLIVWIVRFFV